MKEFSYLPLEIFENDSFNGFSNEELSEKIETGGSLHA